MTWKTKYQKHCPLLVTPLGIYTRACLQVPAHDVKVALDQQACDFHLDLLLLRAAGRHAQRLHHFEEYSSGDTCMEVFHSIIECK